MVLSLFAKCMTFGTIVPVAARTVHPARFSIITRRTLFATNASQGTGEETTRKTAQKRVIKGERAAPVKRGRPPSNHQEKQPKQEQQRVRTPKNLKPPKGAPGPYLLFYTSFLKSQPHASSLQEIHEVTRRASEIWRGYSMAEKQPFYDENEARKAQAKEQREEFCRNTSQSDLKQLNAIRKAQGKPKFHAKKKASNPVSAYLLFSNEFRNSPDGQALINETSPEKNYAVRAVLAAANRWSSMSPEEKAPYFEKIRKAKEEREAGHADT